MALLLGVGLEGPFCHITFDEVEMFCALCNRLNCEQVCLSLRILLEMYPIQMNTSIY